MLRSGSLLLVRHGRRHVPRTLAAPGLREWAACRPTGAPFPSTLSCPTPVVRTLSSETNKDAKKDDETKEIVLSPGEKVVAGARLTMWAGIAAFAAVCAYYIGKELLPT